MHVTIKTAIIAIDSAVLLVEVCHHRLNVYMSASPEVKTRMMVKPMAMNQVMADPSKRPRTPNDAPLDTWLFVPVFGLTGVTARKMNDPTIDPTVMEANAAHQPSPNAIASAPNSMFP